MQQEDHNKLPTIKHFAKSFQNVEVLEISVILKTEKNRTQHGSYVHYGYGQLRPPQSDSAVTTTFYENVNDILSYLSTSLKCFVLKDQRVYGYGGMLHGWVVRGPDGAWTGSLKVPLNVEWLKIQPATSCISRAY